jgi:hypothetical protein
MPSIAVHLTVAARLADRLGIVDFPSYYLGAIVPDSVNADGFASRSERYGAHLRSENYGEWKANILRYRTEAESEYADNPDFFKGFILHLFTDIAWDEEVQPQLFAYLRSVGVSEDRLGEEKWEELRGFDSLLSQSEEYTGAIEYLQNAVPRGITTVSAELSKRWQCKITSLKYPYPPAKFLKNEHIEAAAKKAAEYMENMV